MTGTKILTLSKVISLRSEHILAKSFWIVSFAILTAVGAQIEIATRPVPYTLQTFFVLLAGALLGPRNGFLSMTFYLGLGTIGFPVFSAGGFGLAKLLGPTGGYLLSFPMAAFVIGSLVSKSSNLIWTVLAMVSGLIIIFSIGTLHLHLTFIHNLSDAVKAGFLIFSGWDILKLTAAVVIYRQFANRPSH